MPFVVSRMRNSCVDFLVPLIEKRTRYFLYHKLHIDSRKYDPPRVVDSTFARVQKLTY